MSLFSLWRRAKELTDEIAAIEANLGTRKTLPKAGEEVLTWRDYHSAVIHQNRVKERAVLISQLRRAYHIVPTVDELLA